MSLVTITWTGEQNQVFSITVDATPSETHAQPNLVTDHPVETGANISDHVRPQPDTLEIAGVVTNTPHYLPADHAAGSMEPVVMDVYYPGFDNKQTVEGARRSLGTYAPVPGADFIALPSKTARIGTSRDAYSKSITARGFTEPFDRVRDVFDELSTLRTLGTLLSVDTKLRFYTNMAIVNFGVTKTDAADDMKFTLSLKQVRNVTSARVPVPALPTKKVSKGQVTAKTPTDPADIDLGKESLLHYGVRSAAGTSE